MKGYDIKYELESNRITLVHDDYFPLVDVRGFIDYLYKVILDCNYNIDKIVVKDTAIVEEYDFSKDGFVLEATIPHAMKYWGLAVSKDKLKEISDKLEYQSKQLSELYSKVFNKNYPVNLSNSEYIKKLLFSDGHFYVVHEENNRIVGAAFVIPDNYHEAMGEITHVAVDPDFRGKGLAEKMSKQLEDIIRNNRAYKILYAEARVKSPGMIKTSQKLGYTSGGVLKNHTIIDGSEDLEVFWKKIL